MKKRQRGIPDLFQYEDEDEFDEDLYSHHGNYLGKKGGRARVHKSKVLKKNSSRAEKLSY